MKKVFLLIAVAALLLSACSGSAEEPTTQATTPAAPIVPAVPNTTPPQTNEPIEQELESEILVDNEQICVKITGVEDDPIFGYTLNVYLENKTDKELMFTVDDVAINRYMCDPFWAESVAAGKKSNSSIRWFESNLQENSISEVEEISFTLRVYDANDFFAEDVFQRDFTITP